MILNDTIDSIVVYWFMILISKIRDDHSLTRAGPNFQSTHVRSFCIAILIQTPCRSDDGIRLRPNCPAR